MEINEQISSIKKSFFSYRNGVVSTSLRAAGDPHRYIMGCMLPDIARIAQQFMPDARLASALWAEKEHRECRIAATMLYPIDELDFSTAVEWCNDVENKEIADVLCMKLLRYFNQADKLWLHLINEKSEINQYIGLRLLANLLTIGRLSLTDNISHALNDYAASTSSTGLKSFAISLTED